MSRRRLRDSKSFKTVPYAALVGLLLIPRCVIAQVVSLDPSYTVSLFASGPQLPVGMVFRPAFNDLLVTEEDGAIKRVDGTGAVSIFATVPPDIPPDRGTHKFLGIGADSAGDAFAPALVTLPATTPILDFNAQGKLVMRLSFPGRGVGVALDSKNNLYVISQPVTAVGGQLIYMYAVPYSSPPTIFAGGFTNLAGIAFNSAGELFGLELGDGLVYRVKPGGMIATSHTVIASGLTQPYSVAIEPSTQAVYVGCRDGTVQRINSAGVLFPFANGFSDGTNALAFNPNGDLYVADQFTGAIWKFTKVVGTTISPTHGGNSGTVTAQIISSNLQSGATVKLSGLGPDIVGTNTALLSPSVLSTRFDLTGRAPGTRTVVITNPDDSRITLPAAFTVEQGGAPQVWVDIIGLDKIRIGSEQTFYVTYGNKGNVDAIGVPVGIGGIPLDATWSAGFTTLDTKGNPTRITPLSNNVEQIVPLLLASVPAGFTGALAFTLRVDAGSDFQLRVWNSPPLLQSAEQAQALAQLVLSKVLRSGAMAAVGEEDSVLDFSGGDAECALAVVKGVVGAIGGGCAGEIAQHIASNVLNAISLVRDVSERPVLSLAEFLKSTIFNGISLSFGKCTELEASKLLEYLDGVNELVDILLAGSEILVDCQTALAEDNLRQQKEQRVQSLDPNDIAGPPGYGAPRWVAARQSLQYSVFFGNEETATAPARSVVVTDQLDPTNVDLNTLVLQSVGFGSNQLTAPGVPLLLLGTFGGRVDLRPTTDLIVAITATLDVTTGVFTCGFASIDPATGLPPTNPSVGFLPPGVSGSVLFGAIAKAGIITGTVIDDSASITFDTNPPLGTPAWSNAIDNTAPTSQITALPAMETGASFTVKWSGSDLGSGVVSYAIYVSEDGGSFTPFQTNTSAKSATFTGQTGHTYGFYSIATDAVGNVEGAKTVAEATTTVSISSCATDVSSQVTVTRGGFRFNHATNSFVETVTLTNNGAALAGVSLVLDSLSSYATLSNAGGATKCDAPMGSPWIAVPATLGTGQSASLTLTLSDPTKAAVQYSTRVLAGSGQK